MTLEEVVRQIEFEDGLEKGGEIKAREFVKSLLLNTDHSTEKIASLVDIPESVVLEIKAAIASESPS